jgi:predicted PurR-regulated permease PerM
MFAVTRLVNNLLISPTSNNKFLNFVIQQVKKIDLSQYAANGGKFIVSIISNVGIFSINIFLSLILSMFFMFQKKQIYSFMSKFNSSKIAWLYNETKYFGIKFANSFGKVLETQILISFINCILSVIILSILHFPYILGLGFMIFIFGLIPIAGVIISCIPLSLIAYNMGNWQYVVYILILIIVLHCLESYVLNPKLMSDKTKLPVFFTFLILIISQHFFGTWGLMVGVPIFIFLLDVLDVKFNDTVTKKPLHLRLKTAIMHRRTKAQTAATKVEIDK